MSDAKKRESEERERIAQKGAAIERKPYQESAQEGGVNLDPELESDTPARPGTFGSERSGAQ